MEDEEKMLGEELDKMAMQSMGMAADAVMRLLRKAGVDGVIVIVGPSAAHEDAAQICVRSTIQRDGAIEALEGAMQGMRAEKAAEDRSALQA